MFIHLLNFLVGNEFLKIKSCGFLGGVGGGENGRSEVDVTGNTTI